MSAQPSIRLEALGPEALGRALADVGAPHLPQRVLSDHYAIGNAALRRALDDKIGDLLQALGPHLDPARVRWPGARADVLALDLALVEHPRQPFALAWVEIQAFTSMLPTFHAVHMAHRRLGAVGPDCQPHDALPAGVDWVEQLRGWVAPRADTVLIEDQPRGRATWPDLDGARHWWQVDVHDWRDLVPRHGHLACPVSGRRYGHVWNRLILSDLQPLERRRAEAVLRAADGVGWHSHPAWYEGIHKGTLAEVPTQPHEACHWIEERRSCPVEPSGAWVAKAVGGHSGSGLLLAPTTEQLAALPGARQWIVQRRFRQLPIGRHADTGQPLFGEVRCMLGLREGQAPWVMAWILRLSTDGIATMTGRQTKPGEGMTLLYFEPDGGR